jgi:hypothetical protein
MSESAHKKRRLKIDTGAGRDAVLVPVDGTVADASAAASGRVGERRIRTFALPDGCELDTGDHIADAMEDGEELRAVFEEAGAEGGPDERAGREGPGQGEAKRRRVEQQGAAAVSGSPDGVARDEGKEGSSAGKNGGGGNAGGERGDADEQESGRGMSDSVDDKPLGARNADVKAEKKQKDDESDDDKPLSKLKKESACYDESASSMQSTRTPRKRFIRAITSMARIPRQAGMKMGRRVGMGTRRATTKTRARTERSSSRWSCACGCGRSERT